jgi:folate-dependent phosphoribosylglycinamide formyltransferase PurN
MKILILTFESYQANHIIQQIAGNRSITISGIVRSVSVLSKRNNLQSFFLLMRRSPFFCIHKIIELLMTRVSWNLNRLNGRKGTSMSLRRFTASQHIPLIDTRNINGERTLALIKECEPDLLVSVHFNQRIGKNCLSIPAVGVINVHGSLLPQYRGLFPYFWAMMSGEKEIGVTVHWVDYEFDTGDIILQKKLKIEHDDTLNIMSWKGAKLAAEILNSAIAQIAAGSYLHVQQDHSRSSYYSWPGFSDVRHFYRLGKRFGSIFEIYKYIRKI